MVGASVEEVAVGTVIYDAQRGKAECTQRWDRSRRAALLDQYGALQAQGVSQRQTAPMLHVPRSPRQAWLTW